MKPISNWRIGKARCVALCVSVALLAPVGCDSNERAAAETPKDPWYFADLPAPKAVSPDSLRPFTLVERARYGTWDGIGALDGVNHIVVTDSLLIVKDFRSCEMMFFSRSTQKAFRRFGQCGRGPDQFQNYAGDAFTPMGDSLLIFDENGKRARLFSMQGEWYRTFAMDSFAMPRHGGLHMASVLDDSLVLLAISLPSHQRRNDVRFLSYPDGDYLRLFNVRGLKIIRSRVKDGPGVAEFNCG